jgi:hypothetical protein
MKIECAMFGFHGGGRSPSERGPGALRYALAEQVQVVPVAGLAAAGPGVMMFGTGRRRWRRQDRRLE